MALEEIVLYPRFSVRRKPWKFRLMRRPSQSQASLIAGGSTEEIFLPWWCVPSAAELPPQLPMHTETESSCSALEQECIATEVLYACSRDAADARPVH